MEPVTEADLLEQWLAQSEQVILHGRTFYLREGDLLLTRYELEAYARLWAARIHRERSGIRPQDARLVSSTTAYGDVERLPAKKPITYHINNHGFSDEQRSLLAAAMEMATEDWSAACDVQFKEVCDVALPYFRVLSYDAGGAFLASSFFPTTPAVRRQMLIDPSFFSTTSGYKPVGILRHELGHVLGFRHEHARKDAPPRCPDEDMTETQDLTPYDSKSVMHYLCGGFGNMELAISPVDVIGARSVYGAPTRRH